MCPKDYSDEWVTINKRHQIHTWKEGDIVQGVISEHISVPFECVCIENGLLNDQPYERVCFPVGYANLNFITGFPVGTKLRITYIGKTKAKVKGGKVVTFSVQVAKEDQEKIKKLMKDIPF